MSVSIRHTVSPTMTEEEQKLLRSIGAVRRYPVCRFELRSSKDRELCSVALDAVHLQDAGEQIEPVKERATLLKSLEQKGLIVLYYGLSAYVKSDYQIFHDSAVFYQLQELAVEGGKREDYLFDHAFLKKGQAVLTVKGRYALQRMAEKE